MSQIILSPWYYIREITVDPLHSLKAPSFPTLWTLRVSKQFILQFKHTKCHLRLSKPRASLLQDLKMIPILEI